jgi:hypothetical protein
MSRSRPTKLEKYREHKVAIAHEMLMHAQAKLKAAELAAKTPDDPEVLKAREYLGEVRKLWQEAIDERNGR